MQHKECYEILNELNQFRIKNNIPAIYLSGILMKQCKEHIVDILNNRIPFGLDNIDIRKRKNSHLMQTAELICECSINESPIVQWCKKDKDILLGSYDICGICEYEVGIKRFVHIILGQIW